MHLLSRSISSRLRFPLPLLLILLLRAPLAHSPHLLDPSPIIADSAIHNNIFLISTMSKARVYTDINVIRPREYWDYESFTLHWGYLFASFYFYASYYYC